MYVRRIRRQRAAVNPQQTLTTQEAADWLSLSRRTLETWRITGNGPRYFKLGRAVRYALSELQAFQQQCIRQHTFERRDGKFA